MVDFDPHVRSTTADMFNDERTRRSRRFVANWQRVLVLPCLWAEL